jgi:hypothetical protein
MPLGDKISAMNKRSSPIIRTEREKLCISSIERNRIPPATVAINPTIPHMELQKGADFS